MVDLGITETTATDNYNPKSAVSAFSTNLNSTVRDEETRRTLQGMLTGLEYEHPITIKDGPIGFYTVDFRYDSHRNLYRFTFASDTDDFSKSFDLSLNNIKNIGFLKVLAEYGDMRDEQSPHNTSYVESKIARQRHDLKSIGAKSIEGFFRSHGVEVSHGFASTIFRVMSVEHKQAHLAEHGVA